MSHPEFTIDHQARRAFIARAAGHFERSDFLWNDLAERLVGRLQYIRCVPERIVEVGARLGNATRQLRGVYPQAQILAIEEPAYHAAIQNNTEHATVCQYPDDVARCDIPASCVETDLLFSHLHYSGRMDLDACFARHYQALRPGGLLMCTLLGQDTLAELRATQIDIMRIHAFPDMHDVGDVLLQVGFEDPVVDQQTVRVEYQTVNGLLQDLHRLGAQAAWMGRPRGLTTQAYWQRIARAYPQDPVTRRYQATVEVIFVHAWKPLIEKQRRRGDEVAVSIEHLRRTNKET